MSIPSWIPSVEECWSAFVDGVRAAEGHQNYPAGVAAIRALVAKRHRLFNNQWGGVRVMSDGPAPAQPARSTREPSADVGVSIFSEFNHGRAFEVVWYDETGSWKAHTPITELCHGVSGRIIGARIIVDRIAPPPAREKDGEEFPGEIKQQTATRAAPRSPSPLSASTTEAATALEELAQWCQREIDASHANPHSNAYTQGCEKGLFYARNEARARARTHAPAPSIAQQAAPSEADVDQNLGLYMTALNVMTNCAVTPSATAGRVVVELPADNWQRFCAAVTASRGARGTEDVLRGTVSCLLRASEPKDIKARPLDLDGVAGFWLHKPYAEFLCARWQETHHELAMTEPPAPSRGERREALSKFRTAAELSIGWMRLHARHGVNCQSDDGENCTCGLDVALHAMAKEDVAPASVERARVTLNLTPEEMVQCYESVNGTVLVGMMAVHRLVLGRLGGASVERDAALEEAAKVCDEEVESANRSIASLPPREHELLEHAECSRLVAKLLASRIRALKSPPAPSSASVHVSACKISDDDIAASFGVTPNNRGGAG